MYIYICVPLIIYIYIKEKWNELAYYDSDGSVPVYAYHFKNLGIMYSVSTLHPKAAACPLSLTFDLETKDYEDMVSVRGFLLAILRTLRLCRQGLLWLGTPCRSFSWIATSKHCRSRRNPLGDCSLSFVRCGNILTCRSVILSLIATVRGVETFTEQPSGSTMDIHPYVSWLVYALNIQLGTHLDMYNVRWPFS